MEFATTEEIVPIDWKVVVLAVLFLPVVVVVSKISEVLGLSVIFLLSSELEILLHQGLMSLHC